MSNPADKLLSLASDVLAALGELEIAYRELKEACPESNWTYYNLAAFDALNIAENGLISCWQMLDRFTQLAKAEAKRNE